MERVDRGREPEHHQVPRHAIARSSRQLAAKANREMRYRSAALRQTANAGLSVVQQRSRRDTCYCVYVGLNVFPMTSGRSSKSKIGRDTHPAKAAPTIGASQNNQS